MFRPSKIINNEKVTSIPASKLFCSREICNCLLFSWILMFQTKWCQFKFRSKCYVHHSC